VKKNTSQERAAGERHREELLRHPAFLIRRAFQVYSGIFEEHFADLELLPPEWSVLVVVRTFPGINQSQVALAMAIDKTSSARAIRQLAARGLLAVVESETDRREKHLFVTRKGTRFARDAFAKSEQLRSALTASMQPAERNAFMTGLRAFIERNEHYSRAPFSAPTLAPPSARRAP
jgi:MarR family transcriptional regulator, lower aerobic nicotinate degradation pathway regulator